MNFVRLPKRLGWWLYSTSLVLIIFLIVGFIAVTPIDIVAKTSSSTEDPAVKVVIVTAVCVVFLIWSLIIYFVRVMRLRISMNDIPSKSIYVPGKDDFFPAVWAHVDEELHRCLARTKVRAGPLYASEPINYNGLSPPHYVQRNNERIGYKNLLPPLTRYEEVIQSLGDKFMITSRIKQRGSSHMTKMAMTLIDIPVNYSFKEIVLYVESMYGEGWTGATRLRDLYEKFRFSGELIGEEDMVEFMVEFDKLGQLVQVDREI